MACVLVDANILLTYSCVQNALALLAISAYHTCAPINASCTAQELLDDARRLHIKAIVTTADAAHRLELDHLRQQLGCEIIFLTPKESGPAGLFELSAAYQQQHQPNSAVVAQAHPEVPSTRLHGLNDCSLILHTSGTSGKKKLVPYTLRSLIIGTLAVIKSWELRQDDVDSEHVYTCDPIGRADRYCSEHDAPVPCWWYCP